MPGLSQYTVYFAMFEQKNKLVPAMNIQAVTMPAPWKNINMPVKASGTKYRDIKFTTVWFTMTVKARDTKYTVYLSIFDILKMDNFIMVSDCFHCVLISSIEKITL